MNRFNKIALATVMTLGIAGCSSQPAAAGSTGTSEGNTTTEEKDHLTRIQEAGKIVVGLEGNWQPFSFHDEDDKLVGFDVEVATEVAKRIGVEAEFVEGAWDGLFTGLSTGVYDLVVNGVDVTEDRKATYDFTDPYAYDHTVLVVGTDNTEIKTFEDLEGKTTANSIGSTYMEIGEQYGATVSGVDSLTETMTMVISGQVDATINASTSVNDYLKTTGETRVKIVAESEDATSYAMPLPKNAGNETLLEAINKALAEMREDGTLAELSEKYFGADLTNE